MFFSVKRATEAIQKALQKSLKYIWTKCFWIGVKKMKVSRQSFVCALLNIFLLVGAASFAAGQDKPGNPASDWLNGKWEGRPPAGGELQMTLRVENGNQVRGLGINPSGGRRSAGEPYITGSVIGKKVLLDTTFPMVRGGETKVHYDCTFTEGNLHCRTRSGYETTFKKLE
jgi:hypothetical protein